VNEPSSHTAITALICRSAISAIKNPDDYRYNILIRLRRRRLLKTTMEFVIRRGTL
jgi:hypothetical protein